MSGWTVRDARPEDSAQLQALFTDTFGYDRGAGHYQWNLENPAGAPIVVVAEDAGRIVGQSALWPHRFRVGDEVVMCVQSIDAMAHPDYRGQGMFTQLRKEAMRSAAERGVAMFVGFPIPQHLPWFISMGWEHVGDASSSVRPLHPSQHPRVPPWAEPALDLAARLLPRGAQRGIETRAGRPTDDGMARLVQAGDRELSGYRMDKDAAYLAWRFDERAGRRYHWACAYRDETLTAAAVWGVDAQHGHAFVAELVGVDTHSTRAALALAINQAYAAGCPAILAIGSVARLRPILRRAGFLPRGGGLPIVTHQLSTHPLPVDLHSDAAWSVFGADLDTL